MITIVINVDMKCLINNIEVNAKVTENLGWTQHGYANFVEYQGKEYVVVKKNGQWGTLEFVDKIQTVSQYRGQ
jgi:hypothetical protein